MKKYISPKTASRLLGKHHSHVYRLIQRKAIEFKTEKVERLRVLWDDRKGQLVPAKKKAKKR